MSTERDELAHILSEWLDDEAPLHLRLYKTVADHLMRLGYSKPRIITTAEELDALPDESVVRSDLGVVYEKGYDFDEPDIPWWVTGGDQRQYPARRIALPATVLWEPK